MATGKRRDDGATEAEAKRARGPVRVWADGVFDMVHWGHFNALRQSKALGDHLLVGVHSDEECMRHKGPTVLSLEERCVMIESCKWVDEVVPGAPYITTLRTLDAHRADFCTHGEDITLDENGRDTYAEIKENGRMRTIARSPGVSTTDLVGRLLLATKTHHRSLDSLCGPAGDGRVPKQMKALASSPIPASPYTRMSCFVPTSARIVQFSDGREPAPGDRIVYIDGAFDLFHPGHVLALKAARALGDFLLVGIYTDDEVNAYKGVNHPIMNLHERVLSVLSCKYVDEVIIGAPIAITKEFLTGMRIAAVAHGDSGAPWEGSANPPLGDPYVVPREMGLLQRVSHGMTHLTTTEILERIVHNRRRYEERNVKKEKKEVAHATAAEGD